MELVVRAIASGRPASDLIVVVDHTHTVSDCAAAISKHLGLERERPTLTVARTGVVLAPTDSVTTADLVSGDELLLDTPGAQRPTSIPTQAIALDITAGPDTGRSVVLLPGAYRLGRDPSLEIPIDDSTVSRHQLNVIVAPDWTVTVEPAGQATNPVTVNGKQVFASVGVSPDDVVGLGATGFVVRRFVRAKSERIDRLGQIEFVRTPYRARVVAERSIPEIPILPSRPEPRRFQFVSAVGPLVGGAAMYGLSAAGGNPQPAMLGIMLLSPVMVVGNWFDDKRSRRRKFEEDLARFRDRLDNRRRQIAEALDQERIERHRTAPTVADLGRRAELRTLDLWSRGRNAPDFLRLRIGISTTDSSVRVPAERTTDEELLQMLRGAADGAGSIDEVPLTVSLIEHAVLAVHGDDLPTNGLAAALLLQAACLHSPEDIVVAAAVRPDNPIASWLKWLPHTRSVTSPLAGQHVVTTKESANELGRRLLEVAAFRLAAGSQERNARTWPRVVLFVEGGIAPDQVVYSQLLDVCGEAGISVVWCSQSEAALPRQATAIVHCVADPTRPRSDSMWFTDPELAPADLDIEQVRPVVADRVARALAPVRDASTATLATSIPRTVPLLSVLGNDAVDPASIAKRWAAAGGYHLAFPVGVAADGPLVLDLVEDGPHTLIGGTSGSGKSELLQAMVASLAAQHPPTRLNFLFVDYKGGAASDVFSALPHTVGSVTNLSAELSLRALTSLRAELNRRMRVLAEHHAKDLRELFESNPDVAPPSLVIVIDEFATLVKEIPDFVAGIVDIAQRGRSLGIHLVLATQRPSGSVNDNILANTNLRISLRMLERSESTAILNSPEAADIPVPLRGRAFARRGPRSLVSFQSAYCSAPLTSSTSNVPVLVGPFDNTGASPKAPSQTTEGRTQLSAVLSAITVATERLALPVSRRPWRDVLSPLITLDDVLADPRTAASVTVPGRFVPVGMVDAPEDQDQFPLVLDLEQGGGCIVYGTGGSGKSTFLRTLALAACRTSTPQDLAIFGLDFGARGLTALASLPHVVGIANGDDLEAATRLIAVLEGELGRRRALIGDAGAENLTAYNEEHPQQLPRILLLVDNLGGLLGTFSRSSGSLALSVPLEAWGERVLELIAEGRQAGIHVVATADRRASVPMRTQAAISNRIVLRHADESGYGDHGIAPSRAKGLTLSDGAGLWQGTMLMQTAVASQDSSASAQALAIGSYARSLASRPQSPLSTARLHDRVEAAELSETVRELTIALGRADVTGATVEVDLLRSNFLVAGPPGSGRSLALVRSIRSLERNGEVWHACLSGSPLADIKGDFRAVGAVEVTALLDRLLASATGDNSSTRRVLVVDDLDSFDNPDVQRRLEAVVKLDSVRIIASIDTRNVAGYTPNVALNEMRRARRVLLLQPTDANEVLQAFNVKVPLRPGLTMPAGRGVLIAGRATTIVQVAVD